LNLLLLADGGIGAVVLKPPEFFRSTRPIRPWSKIGRNKIPVVCLAFCRSAPIKSAAEHAGLSPKAIRDLYRSFRALLTDPRYRKWHSYDDLPVFELPNAERIETEIWRCFSACYANDECFRNYRYGKRTERQCSNCPVRRSGMLQDVLPASLITGMLERIDTMRAHYQNLLGHSREGGNDPVENFKLRMYHTTIVLSARLASSHVEDGVVKSSFHVEGPETLNELWMTILRHIEEQGTL
jgi:hypothetical protein